MPAQTTSPPSTPVSPRRLWFGATGAAVAWALQSTVCTVISSKACQNNVGNWGPLSPLGVRWLMGGITFVALAIAIAAGLASFRNWRTFSERQDLVRAEAGRRETFMAFVGVFSTVIFVIGILWAGIPLIMLDVCVKAR